jgi:hypothetical protein
MHTLQARDARLEFGRVDQPLGVAVNQLSDSALETRNSAFKLQYAVRTACAVLGLR